MKNMKSSKKIGLVIGILMFALLLVGATYAFWLWRGNVASVNTTVGVPFYCAADGGVHASTVALAPAACTHDRFAIQREITVDHGLIGQDTSLYMDMVLTVNSIGAGLAASSNFKYALTKSADSCTKDVLASGTFKNVTSGSSIDLFMDRSFNYSQELVENKYYLYIWIDAVEDNDDVLNQTFDFSLNLECTQGYESGATMLINKANAESITTYSSGNKEEMYAFSQPATEQLSATTDYRYIGDRPNNYITFNGEMWRIIGVFDGKIKIIKNLAIGELPFDYKTTGVGSSTSSDGSNDWVDAQLMYMLNSSDIATNVYKKDGYTYNGTYVYDKNGKIIYRNGCVPVQASGSSYSCTANTWSLNTTALSQIVNETYYLGGVAAYSGFGADDFYAFERGETIYNDSRSINWNGKVGLMYPSDYGYTFAYGVDDTCYSNIWSCETSAPESSWLYVSSYTRWTLNPYTVNDSFVFVVHNLGRLSNNNSYNNVSVRPVVYLKDSVMLSGTGTSTDPYEIVSNF